MAAFKIVLALAMLALAAARPQQQQRGGKPATNEPIAIVRLENEGVNHDGSYKFSYETANGITADESGYVKQLGGKGEEDSEAQVVEGSYSYTGPDGVVYTIKYIADENGYRAEGAHLPTPPPVPEEIQRSLDFIATQPQQAAAAAKSPARG